MDTFAYHDLPPVANRPISLGQTVIERGDVIQFESSALPNDLVDDMSTMQPYFEYSKSSLSNWDDSWIIDIQTVGGGQNIEFIHTLQTDINADTGNYDIRIKWVDSSASIVNGWLLKKCLSCVIHTRVLDADDTEYMGMPVVKLKV